MTEDTKKFMDVLFDDGEHVYAAPDQYASNHERGIFRPSVPKESVPDGTVLVSINPLRGETRLDELVTAYRSFLVEIDDGTLEGQYEYVKDAGLPYSACVYSGNKSLHFCVTLDEDLPSESVYRYLAEWILKIVGRADQKTKNPSRSIRFPGAQRPGGNVQKLLELRSRVPYAELSTWLYGNEWARPKTVDRKERSEEPDLGKIAPWVKAELVNGIDESRGRNQRWFAIGYEFGLAGFDTEDSLDILADYYEEEYDFKRGEWASSVKNGVNKAIKDTGRER